MWLQLQCREDLQERLLSRDWLLIIMANLMFPFANITKIPRSPNIWTCTCIYRLSHLLLFCCHLHWRKDSCQNGTWQGPFHCPQNGTLQGTMIRPEILIFIERVALAKQGNTRFGSVHLSVCAFGRRYYVTTNLPGFLDTTLKRNFSVCL